MGTNECSQPASKSSWDSQDFGDVNMVLKMVHFHKSSRPQWVNIVLRRRFMQFCVLWYCGLLPVSFIHSFQGHDINIWTDHTITPVPLAQPWGEWTKTCSMLHTKQNVTGSRQHLVLLLKICYSLQIVQTHLSKIPIASSYLLFLVDTFKLCFARNPDCVRYCILSTSIIGRDDIRWYVYHLLIFLYYKKDMKL